MSEILFRAHTGRYWIEGYPIKVDVHGVQTWRMAYDGYESHGHTQLDYFPVEEINPETLSQFTGLFDKNDKKLFEGDIFENDAGCRYLVFFEDGCFMAQLISDNPWPTKLHLSAIHHLISTECENIGNKWEDPKLLKPKATYL